MSPTVTAIIGYIALMVVLLLVLASVRLGLSLGGKRQPNSFAPDGADVSPFANRLCRSHANAYESFPIFGGLMLLAVALGATAITNGLALYLLGARVLQSVTHLASTSNIAVQVRFLFFVIQVVIAIWWLVQFIQQ